MTRPDVPLNDLARAVREHRAELDGAMARVLESGWFALGPEVRAFEAEFAAYLGVDHVIGVANGTDALELALLSVGTQPDDSVVTVANAGGYASTAIAKVGGTAVYVDVDADSLLMTAAALRPALDLKPRAVIVTHLYGQLVELDEIAQLCRERGVALIEDCAQAAGASRAGVAAGSVGDVAAFSFYPTKNLGALGDGGALATSSAERAETLRALRQYGWNGKYHATQRGGRNSRLDEIQAAVLRTRLPHVDVDNSRRRTIHAAYADALPSVWGHFVHSAKDEGFVAHLAVLRSPHRDHLRQVLTDRGIGTDIHYPVPDHQQPIAAGRASLSLPETERGASEILTVPCFPELTDAEIEKVCDALAAL